MQIVRLSAVLVLSGLAALTLAMQADAAPVAQSVLGASLLRWALESGLALVVLIWGVRSC